MKTKIKFVLYLSVFVLLLKSCSPSSDDISETIDTTRPVAGTLSFSNLEETSVTINWTPFTDENGISRIIVLRDNVEVFSTSSTSVLSFVDTGLQPETAYSYVARGFDEAQNVATSNAITITTGGVNNRALADDLNMPPGVIDDSFITWDTTTGTVEFTKDVTFSIGANQTEIDNDKVDFYYEIPSKVKEIVIKENVTITGHFRFVADVVIRGENRETSVIYGTSTRAWSLGPNKTNDSPNCNEATGDDRAADCQKWKFGTISGNENGVTLTVQDLTMRNPRSYAVTSFNSKIIMDNVYVHNSRPSDDGEGGDYNSNSDGISAGKDSVVRNCKFDTWDDSIKLYKDMTVENVTIVQNGNGSPFQLGWGDKPDTEHTLNNILIVTNNQNYSNLTTFAISGETASLNTVINLGDFFIDIESSQTFRNTGQSLPVFLNKSSGTVNITLNEVGNNYNLNAPKGFAEYNNQGTYPGGNFTITGNICGIAITGNNTTITCGTPSSITGCGW